MTDYQWAVISLGAAGTAIVVAIASAIFSWWNRRHMRRIYQLIHRLQRKVEHINVYANNAPEPVRRDLLAILDE
jgi:hypothetical protein